MSRSLRRGGTAAIVLALAAVSLSACSAGSSAETTQIKPDSPATSLGADLKLNAIVAVVDPVQTSGQPGPANLTVNISNTGANPQTLQTVTLNGATATFDDASGAPLPGGIVIPAGGAVLVGGSGQPSAVFSSVALNVGGFTPASFSFSSAGKVDTTAMVTPAAGYYASFGPASPSASASAGSSVPPSGSAAPSAGASAGGSSSASASGAPSGTPSGSPSGTPSGSPSGSPAGTPSGSTSPSAH
ncbi:DUF461 domain-containing protein [Kitasatospora sp. NBC_01302]|uniref:DUF461 domain-containing protein n=1 Tax=Kitasatospora sp. NBC_01302 TaxID=2903575 RepID=UPI002E0E7BBF|nr:DUF461 domain-containing protein [Kitasatospora sp. NBC_01302]